MNSPLRSLYPGLPWFPRTPGPRKLKLFLRQAVVAVRNCHLPKFSCPWRVLHLGRKFTIGNDTLPLRRQCDNCWNEVSVRS